ncbi:type II toxin-antitoxin system Phd/YefM family antitoxin [Amycolatopsis suaedae]|uniref:Type II toxin-antitoxin system Phd/YefM family antitoxin n=1 Tax=Amycolatopsis suaedae TaxID=2510978 RepID=A0A4Q7J9M3_9PSEU|nr:type II toxin-antitoxin system Phd/YefM family antitoxin [Amycolatopsis suaedae]RZQ63636.1 type II toxin-antitoxin system Phd/YefM family antitoxin [Amycolatopsis suaedae]
MTATEASRNFRRVLNLVEAGESVALTRYGETIATIVPTPRSNADAVRSMLDDWHASPEAAAIDDEFAERVAAVRAKDSAELDRDPWLD